MGRRKRWLVNLVIVAIGAPLALASCNPGSAEPAPRAPTMEISTAVAASAG
ncbi:MAG: hypothetical protein AB7L13_21550 [Acidimicrobiia bacterium]